MRFSVYDLKERFGARRSAGKAFREYARNGWESPWVRRNSVWHALKK